MLPVAFSLSEKRNQDRLITFVSSFFSIFLQIADRVPCKEGEIPLHENPYFTENKPRELFELWGFSCKGISPSLHGTRSAICKKIEKKLETKVINLS